MKRLIKYLRRTLYFAIGFSIFAMAAIVILLHTSFGRNRIRAQIESILADSFPGGAKVGAVEGSVFGTLIIRDIELDGSDHLPFVTVNRVAVAMELVPLVRKQAKITSLVITGVDVDIHPTPPEPEKPAEPGAREPNPWEVQLPSIEVRDVKIAIVNPGAEPIHIDNAALTTSVHVPGFGDPTEIGGVVAGATWRERGNAPIWLVTSPLSLGKNMVIPTVSVVAPGALIVVDDVRPDLAGLTGHLRAFATPAAVATFAPHAMLTDPITIDATIAGPMKHVVLDLDARYGAATAHATVIGDLDRKVVEVAMVRASAPDLARLAMGKVSGAGDLLVVASGGLDGASGTIVATETIDTLPGGTAVVAFAATRTKVTSIVVATGPGGASAGIASELAIALPPAGSIAGVSVTITRAQIDAAVDDIVAASLGKVEGIGGHAHVVVAVAPGGTLSPAIDVVASGTINGRNITRKELRIAAADARFSARVASTADGKLRPIGSVHADVRGISNAGKPLGYASVDASNRGGDPIGLPRSPAGWVGPIDAIVHYAHPTAVVADLDAVVHLPTDRDPLTVNLGKHHVTILAAKRALDGTGGTITVLDDKVIASKIVTSHQGGKVALEATFVPSSQNLTAQISTRDIALAIADPKLRGTATADFSIARTYGAWSGSGKASVLGVQFNDKLVVDGSVQLKLANRRVSLIANGTLDPPGQTQTGMFTFSALHGAAEIALEVDGPRDITDPHAWAMLTRKDLRAGSVTIRQINGGLFGASGNLDGTVLLSPSDTHGTIEVRGVTTPAGTIDADVAVDNANGEIGASAKAKVEGVGLAEVTARIAIPDHLFDIAAWKSLGRGAVRSASAHIDNVVVDPDLLARFNIKAPYRGHAKIALEIGEGIESATFTLDADGLKGGVILKPLDLHAHAEMDRTHSMATLDVATGAAKLLHLDGSIPYTFESWMADGIDGAKLAQLDGNLVIPPTQAATVLAIVGRSDIVSGTLDGTGKLGGTFGAPTASATVAAHDITVPPHVSGRPIPVLTKLSIESKWDGSTGSVEIIGSESDGGRLKIAAHGRPDRRAGMTGLVDLASFDIAPLAAFLPGAFVSTSGKVAGHFDVTSFELASLQAKGKLVMENGKIPISSYVGTMRDTHFALELDGRKGKLELGGNIGQAEGLCTRRNTARTNCHESVKLTANGDLDTITASMELYKLQPITALQPIITGTATAIIAREGSQFSGSVKVRGTTVQIPEQKGNELHAVKPPNDMVFVDDTTPLNKGVKPPPDKPWLTLAVDIGSTRVSSEEMKGSIDGSITMNIGDTPMGVSVGMYGVVQTEDGTIDLFGRRYQIDHANVQFDGTYDASLDIRLLHEFQELTLMANVTGRISNPLVSMSSDPGGYTEGQLFGFFLGGEPGGDPNSQTKDAALGGGASILTQRISKTVNKVLPVKIDVITCSTATCTIGKWVSEKIFISYNRHLEAKPDENANEGQIEYYLRHDLYLEGNAGDRSHHGLDLLWRHRW